MTLQQLLYFREILYSKGYTPAAKKLYTSQPNNSHAIQSLEEELSVPLFIRQSGQKIVLSEYGKAFLPYVEKVFTAIEEGVSELKSMKDPLRGTVHIGYGYIPAEPVILNALRKYYKSIPPETISIKLSVQDNTDMLLQMFKRDELDFFFAPQLKDPELSCMPVAKQSLCVYMPSCHALANRSTLCLEDLREEPIFLFALEEELSEQIPRLFMREGITPHIARSCFTITELLTYISSGYGVAILPRFPTNDSNILSIPLEHPLGERTLFMYWGKSASSSPAVEHVRKNLIEYFMSNITGESESLPSEE